MSRFRSYLRRGTVTLLTLTIAIGCFAVPISSPTPAAQIQAAGNVYYVAPTGNDSDPGTQDKPWRTIQRAANMMEAGDAATVLPGTYSERVHVTGSGSSGAPITYQARGTVVMNGFTVIANYIDIKGFEITNTPDDSRDGYGVFVEGTNCVIEDNYIHYATRGGILLFVSAGNYAETSSCIVRNNRLYRNAMNGIEVRGRNHLIEGNEVWGTIQHHPSWLNPPSWIDADGMRFHGSGHIFRKNYIHDIHYGIPENIDPHIDCFQTFGSMPYQEVASNVIFEQNTCVNVEAQSPTEVGQGWMIENARNLTIRNNIIRAFRGINCVGCGALFVVNNVFAGYLSFNLNDHPSGISRPGSNSVIKNNVFYDLPAQIIYAPDPSADIGYNCVYESDGRSPWSSPYPHDLWNVNPMFVNPTANDFHLRPNSPAIDAGLSLASVVDDFDGNPRPQGAGYDIGAYEFLVSSKAATPLAAHMNEIITYTITVAGNGNPTTVIDPLPLQVVYLTSTLTCPGIVTYDAAMQQVEYTGTPPIGRACVIQISARVNTDQRMAIANSATIDNGQPPLQSVSATVILNGLDQYLPIILKLG